MTTRFEPEVLDYEKANGEVEHREGTRFADSSSLATATTRDSEKAGSSRYASSTIGLEHQEASKKLEQKLVRKQGQQPISILLRFIPAHSLAFRVQMPSYSRWLFCSTSPLTWTAETWDPLVYVS